MLMQTAVDKIKKKKKSSRSSPGVNDTREWKRGGGWKAKGRGESWKGEGEDLRWTLKAGVLGMELWGAWTPGFCVFYEKWG